jgi:hypothetical protein
MKAQLGLMMAVMFISSHSASSKGDWVISITSLEHRGGSTDKPYRVGGKTAGPEPTEYYELVCESGAVHLEVGHQYKAETRGTKAILIFPSVKDTPTSSGLEGIECEVKSVRTTA